MLIDTHTHIYAKEFEKDRAAMMQRATEAGIDLMLLPAIDKSTFGAMQELAKNYPNQVKMMIGLHPCSVKDNVQEELALVEAELNNKREKYIAIGEIGIDLFWDKTTLDQQTEAFRTQLRWAKVLKLPVAIHVRNSFDEIFAVLEAEKTENLNGVLHCFTGGKRHVLKARELGFYMGIGGVVTFPGSGIDHVLKRINLDEIILETDAPYLAPVPYKGERNEPAFITKVAEKVAEIKGISVTEVADITSANAKKLFKL